MKTVILPVALLMFTFFAQAQNGSETTTARYTSAMEKNVNMLDTAASVTAWTELANNFDRIAAAEKNKWEAYYYAAYCYTLMAANSTGQQKVDLLADKAEIYLAKADSLQKDNSEVAALFAMLRAVQLSADPMGRYQTLLPEVDSYVALSKKLDAGNPRAYFVEARFKYRVPEMMGGGKDLAQKLVAEALVKFDQFKPANSMSPRWGQQAAKQLQEKMK